MNCLSCVHATTKSPTGGISAHRAKFWKLGYVGCGLEKSEATSYSINYRCDKWAQASAEQMAQRKPAC